MKKYDSKKKIIDVSLLKRFKVYSKEYIASLEKGLKNEENSLLAKKLYKPFYLD